MEHEFCMTILDWVEDLTQSVWIFCIKFDTWKEHWRLSVLEGKQFCSECKTVLRENHVNRESNILELTIYLYNWYDEHEAPRSCSTTVYLSIIEAGLILNKDIWIEKFANICSSQNYSISFTVVTVYQLTVTHLWTANIECKI